MVNVKKGSTISAMLWMLLLSILLCWIPVFGALIAGVVGGKKAGGVGSAVLAVFLPAIMVGGLLFVFATFFTGFPGMGLLAGLGGVPLAAINVGPLLLGAIIGALLID